MEWIWIAARDASTREDSRPIVAVDWVDSVRFLHENSELATAGRTSIRVLHGRCPHVPQNRGSKRRLYILTIRGQDQICTLAGSDL